MKKKYMNYYYDKNIFFKFVFENFDELEALRIQAFLLQDSHFIINDPEVLTKIIDEKPTIIKTRGMTSGAIYISRSDESDAEYTLNGRSISVNKDSKVEILNYHGNILEGLNFISIIGFVIDEKKNNYKFSEINWCHEQTKDMNRLVRYNIKRKPLTSNRDTLDLEGDDIIYDLSDDYSIKKDPSELFKSLKNKEKVLKK